MNMLSRNILKLLGLMSLLLASFQADAQYFPSAGWSHPASQQGNSRWIPGGNIMVNFGNVNSFVDISPSLLYQVTERFQAGAGVNYLYRSLTYGIQGSNFKLESHNYGGRALTRYIITNGVFANAEYMLLNVEAYRDLTSSATERVWFHNPMAGVGAYVPLGGRATAFVVLNYMFNTDQRLNPYNNFVLANNFNLQVGIGF